MGKIKSKETKLEKSVWKILSEHGIRYRKNSAKHFGKPDIVIASKKLVIFIDSCFWHKCPKHFRKPNSNKFYWKAKIDRNVKRAKEVNKQLKKENWKQLKNS